MFFKRYGRQWVGRFHNLSSYSKCIHGFSTRQGGVSAPPFDSLNMGFNTEDTPALVTVNRERLLQKLHVSEACLAIPGQIHGNTVRTAGSPGQYPDTDALITKENNVALMIQVADCVPVFLYDPAVPCIGLVHAGWRGSVENITRRAVEAMIRDLKADPKTLMACIGPSIGPDCYQVGREVQAEFDKKYIAGGNLDLWACNRDQCREAGIPDSHILISGICTHCNPAFFFSNRTSGGRTGRMMAVMMLHV